jgi:signal transduction histidine kinase
VAEKEDIQNAEEQIALLRAELSALKSELEQTNRNSRQYLQNVAHQLTAPLGAIKWSIEALQDKEVAFPRKLKLFSSIYSQATILVHLIKCGFRAMPISVPIGWRSRFRSHADHDSEMMAITVPTGSRSLFGGPRNGDRHRRNHFIKPSS